MVPTVDSGSAWIIPYYTIAVSIGANLKFVSAGSDLDHLGSNLAGLQGQIRAGQALTAARLMQGGSCDTANQHAEPGCQKQFTNVQARELFHGTPSYFLVR